MTICHKSFVDTLVPLVPVEDIHTHLAEGGAVVCKGTVTERWAWYGGEPAVEDGELRCKGSKDGQFVRREVVENQMGVVEVMLLVEVTLDEALHVWFSAGVLCKGNSAE